MKKIKKIITSPIFSIAAVVLAAGLLIFSSVGGARAALTYFSDDYKAQVNQYDIGVTLLENGEPVAYRDYIYGRDDEGNRTGTGTWNETPGEGHWGPLCAKMLGAGEKLKLGKEYPEAISIRNSGTINEFARVTLYKYWKKGENKDLTKDPSLIKLHLTPGTAWDIDYSATGKTWFEADDPNYAKASDTNDERAVLYYKSLLNSKQDASAPLSDTLTIDDKVALMVDQVSKEVGKETVDGVTYTTTTITTTYIYDGCEFVIEAHVDAIQEHNAAAAAKSAWGENVRISGSSLELIQ